MTHYSTLQVSRNAEPEVIDRAYKALSLKYHPDRVSELERAHATRKMQRINAAYAVLSDVSARREYDRSLPHDSASASAWDTFMAKGLLGMFLDKMTPPQ